MTGIKEEFIYKYKSLSKPEYILHILDIIENSRLYLPDVKELNDVFECPNSVVFPGTAGSSIWFQAGKLPPVILEKRNGFKVLSLTDNHLNPVMWAHYADNYHGICLIFNKIAFGSVSKVSYVEHSNHFYHDGEIEDYDEFILESLKRKHEEWTYESEFRLIQRTDNQFLSFGNNLRGVIFGHKYKKNRSIECALDKKQIPKFKTYIDEIEGKIVIVDYNFEPILDGRKYDYIEFIDGEFVKKEDLYLMKNL